MADKIDQLVENINDIGNEFIDKVMKPFIKGGKKILFNEVKAINYFLKFKTEYIEQKITLYIEYMKDKNEEDIINFIDDLKEEDRKFLTESLNKVFELNDNLQIYILAYLTKEYQKNGALNYFEKSIYYNIQQISEDDLKAFSGTILKLKPSENNDQAFPLNKNDLSDIENIVLVKFENIGIIQIVHGYFGGPFVSKTAYSDKLANVIKGFCTLSTDS